MLGSRFVISLFSLSVLYILLECSRPDILLVGNVTVDVVQTKGKTESLPGGAVTYAASVAQGLRKRSCIITAATESEDLSVLGEQDVHPVPSDEPLTFLHSYTWFGNQRKLRVRSTPNVTLSASDVPFHCLMARIVMLGPLVQSDVDVPSFTHPTSLIMKAIRPFQIFGLMGQGLQRNLGPRGQVQHMETPSKPLMASLASDVHLFLSDVETDDWPSDELQSVISKIKSLVVTRGAKGVSIHQDGQPTLHIPAVKIDPVDTNGAGDTFATSFMVALDQDMSIRDAGMSATWAASRVCLKPQTCKPACAATAVREKHDSDLQPGPQMIQPPDFKLENIHAGETVVTL